MFILNLIMQSTLKNTIKITDWFQMSSWIVTVNNFTIDSFVILTLYCSLQLTRCHFLLHHALEFLASFFNVILKNNFKRLLFKVLCFYFLIFPTLSHNWSLYLELDPILEYKICCFDSYFLCILTSQGNSVPRLYALVFTMITLE